MNRSAQQFAAAYLAVCLALAGLVGLSPVLHQWIEHGGQGQVHSHLGWVVRASASQVDQNRQGVGHRRDHAHTHLHDHSPRFQTSSTLFRHNASFGLRISLDRLWHALNHLCERPISSDPSSPENPAHEHHSLAQLLASGLVEGAVDVSIDLSPPTFTGLSLPTPESLMLLPVWNPQCASRGPPIA